MQKQDEEGRKERERVEITKKRKKRDDTQTGNEERPQRNYIGKTLNENPKNKANEENENKVTNETEEKS